MQKNVWYLVVLPLRIHCECIYSTGIIFGGGFGHAPYPVPADQMIRQSTLGFCTVGVRVPVGVNLNLFHHRGWDHPPGFTHSCT